MHEDCERIVTDDMLDRVLAVFARQLELLCLDRPTGVGNINRAVDQRREARSGTASRNRHDDL